MNTVEFSLRIDPVLLTYMPFLTCFSLTGGGTHLVAVQMIVSRCDVSMDEGTF